jgi:16S rRNA (guanine527-N7)-methyltransferase
MREALAKLLQEALIPQSNTVCASLWAYAEELLRWNARVNLTAITKPDEVMEKHLVDSLTVLAEIGEASTLLDLGAGAGLPGLPLAIACPNLKVQVADAVSKKVAFMKAAVVKLGLVGRVHAVHVHARGQPEGEGLFRADVVVSRAFRDVEPWLALARYYVNPGGCILAMTGQAPADASLHDWATANGVAFERCRVLRLPRSGDPRAIIRFRAPAA